MYEEATDDWGFEMLCENVASEVTMHPKFVSLLQRVAKMDHVTAVVVTCVWPSSDLAGHTSKIWPCQYRESNRWRPYQERINHSASESILGGPFAS
jgi:hypothetical protein